jgi:hypothetical protein
MVPPSVTPSERPAPDAFGLATLEPPFVEGYSFRQFLHGPASLRGRKKAQDLRHDVNLPLPLRGSHALRCPYDSACRQTRSSPRLHKLGPEPLPRKLPQLLHPERDPR